MDGDVGRDGVQMLSDEVSDGFGLSLGLWCGAPIYLRAWVLGVRKSCEDMDEITVCSPSVRPPF